MSDMIEVKTADLIGLALNYAVGIADERELELPSTAIGRQYVAWCDPFVVKQEGRPDFYDKTRRKWEPSTDWNHCGPLIEEYDVELIRFGEQAWYERDPQWNQKPCVGAVIRRAPYDTVSGDIHIEECMTGETRLIAACRAIVRAKLGETVQIPAALVTK